MIRGWSASASAGDSRDAAPPSCTGADRPAGLLTAGVVVQQPNDRDEGQACPRRLVSEVVVRGVASALSSRAPRYGWPRQGVRRLPAASMKLTWSRVGHHVAAAGRLFQKALAQLGHGGKIDLPGDRLNCLAFRREPGGSVHRPCPASSAPSRLCGRFRGAWPNNRPARCESATLATEPFPRVPARACRRHPRIGAARRRHPQRPARLAGHGRQAGHPRRPSPLQAAQGDHRIGLRPAVRPLRPHTALPRQHGHHPPVGRRPQHAQRHRARR